MSVTRPARRRRPSPSSSPLTQRYLLVRGFTEELCTPLETEDYVIQGMADVSPPKWHLAHTTWFFETFVLSPRAPGYVPFDPRYAYLFNSYYVQAGERWARPHRGLLSRPTVAEIYLYRHHVDQAMTQYLDSEPGQDVRALVEIGLQHEQQHQELLLTDTKYNLSLNPLRPAYRHDFPPPEAADSSPAAPLRFAPFDESVEWIGHDGPGFCYDNETPRHRQLVHGFELADRLVTNAEYLEFIEEEGYERAELWLSEGWATVQARGWQAPLYWEKEGKGNWTTFTLRGQEALVPDEPVTHVSYFEADAYARWCGACLPTEAQWEVASRKALPEGNFVESLQFHPSPAPPSKVGSPLRQMFGDTWEWTASPYGAYPGYRPAPGALGEYNGKFMCNQMVLRGGSCATSATHIRPTYRNFFPPDARWQFSGIRLAKPLA